MKLRHWLLFLFLLSITPLFSQNGDTPSSFDALRYRNIGPARGGRVTAVTGISQKPFTFLMGATGGGVWKTTDGGLNWSNISDGYFEVGSIGAIALAPSDENVIYVGTGSACPRGNISPGNGIYKSQDGGRSWQHTGLPKAGQIARIRVHPDNPHLVYAAVAGNIFGPNPERGVYRSRDGGENWENVLYVSERTGAIDLAMDPNNPRILYAGMWTAQRKPWTLIDGGREGGVWKTTDGGNNWTQLRGGLPTGLTGRVGIAVSPANPQRVWVLQEAKPEKAGGLYRSDDGGQNFKRINREHKLRQRAWYYNHVFADPQDEHTIYILNAGMYKSVDGGEHFQRISTPHGDNHDLWINPDNPEIMVEGNDGGACVSLNGGETWTTQLNQPTSEFYRLTVDDQFPYRVYGAQQDNSTISVPSRSQGGITPYQEWYAVGGGESGHIALDPRNPEVIYAGSYIGKITHMQRKHAHTRDIVAYPQMHDGVAPRNIRYRFQWNAPIRVSPHNPDVLYHCSQYVHRSTDAGQTWEKVSPDLTTDKDAYQNIPGGPIQHDHTGVELYTTIFAFEISPHEAGVLWAGTDDGRLHLSRDDGASWNEITPQNLPTEGTINTIELSAHAAGRAIISVYKYRDNDFRPYIFLTDDYGASWKLLTTGDNGIPEDEFVRVAREDPERKGLLYAGTEYGVYLSFDEGHSWQSLQLNLPHVPITDMQVKDHDLVLATQGRSFWILDDLTPLREWKEEIKESQAKLFPPAPAYRTQLRSTRGAGSPEPNPNGAILYFYLSEMPDSGQTVTLEIIDPEGRVRRTFTNDRSDESDQTESLSIQPGLNRLIWDMKYEGPETLDDAVFSLAYTGAMAAMPGVHQIRLRSGSAIESQTIQLRLDPRWSQQPEDLRAQHDLTVQVMDLLNQCHATIRKLRSVRNQLKRLIRRKLPESEKTAIENRATAIVETLNGLESELIQTQSESGQDPINYPPKLDDQIAYLYTIVNGQDDRPTAGAYERYEDLKAQFEQYRSRYEKVITGKVGALNGFLDERGVHVIDVER